MYVATGAAVAAPFAYVPKAGLNRVAKIDLATGTTVADVVVQSAPLASTVSRNGQRVYAVLQTAGKVAVIDTATFTVATNVTVGTRPWSATLSPDDSRLYVMNTDSNSISVIDTATDAVVATIPVGMQPQQLAVSPDGTRGYLTASPNKVQVIDLVNGAVLSTNVVGNLPHPIVLNAAGTRAYVAYAGDSTIRVFDTATNAVVGSVALGTNKAPNGVVLSPDQQTLYVSQFLADQVVEVDVATLTLGTTHNVGSRPYGIDITADGARVYVANRDGHTLSVIDTATDAVGTISLGANAQPWAIGRILQPAPLAVAITSASPPGGQWHTSYTFAVTTAGTPAPTVSVATGDLPPGLTLGANGVISGTPTQVGTYTGTLQAVSGSTTVTQPFSIVIAPAIPVPPTIDNVVPGDGTVTVYFTPAPVDGNDPPYAFNAFCGFANTSATSPIVIQGLPNGVSVTCTTNAVNTAGGGVASAPFGPVTPGVAPAFTAFTPLRATWNVPYNYTVIATGSPVPMLSITSGALPLGLTFDAASSTISGTPTVVGSATVRLKATNAVGEVTSGDLTIVVDAAVPAAPASVVATPGDGQVSLAFAAPGHWGGEAGGSYAATCTPAGSATGVGSPLIVGGLANGVAVTCSVRAVNTAGAGASTAAAPVTPGVAPAFAAFAPPRATWNASYSYTVIATGSPTPTLSLASGTLPTGLTFDAASGTIGGTPTAIGSATVHLKATNALGEVTSGDLTIVVDAVVPAAPASVTATPGDRQVSLVFAAPSHWGGETTGSYTATCTPGTGSTTGTASPLTVTGLTNGVAVTCSVAAINGAGTGPAMTAAPVTPGVAPVFGTFAPPRATWSASYSYTVTATGSPAPTFSIASGALPLGLTLDGASGIVSGTPTVIGSATVQLKATNAFGEVTSADLTIVVDATVPAAPATLVATPGNGQVSLAFAPPSHWGGEAAGSYTATCTPGTGSTTGTASPLVVAGLTNGVATTCSVSAVNGVGTGPSVTAAPVTPGVTPSFDPFAPPRATWNAPYTYTVTTTGSPAPTLSIASGTLPLGLAFDAATGTIGGTPTVVGSATVRLTATNSVGAVTSGDLTIVVDPVLPTAPASVTATPGNGQVSLVFDAPSSWGGATGGSYHATCSPGTGTATGTASPLTVTGLTNGVAVTCSVAAVNGAGTGPATAATPVTPRAPVDLDVDVDNATDFVAGGSVVDYLIVVGNDGPNVATGVQLVDVPSSTLTAITWTCTSTGGAACPAASGIGAIDATLTLPAGGSVRYVLSGTVPTLPETPLVHGVSVLAPNSVIDGNPANDSATDGPDTVGVFRDDFE